MYSSAADRWLARRCSSVSRAREQLGHVKLVGKVAVLGKVAVREEALAPTGSDGDIHVLMQLSAGSCAPCSELQPVYLMPRQCPQLQLPDPIEDQQLQ